MAQKNRSRINKCLNKHSALFISIMLIYCMAGCAQETKNVKGETINEDSSIPLTSSDEEMLQKQSAVDKIIKKHAEAIGYEDFKYMENTRVRGKMRTYTRGGIKEATYTLVLKRPDCRRFDLEVKGQPIIMTYDGTTVWVIDPFKFHGSLEPKKLQGMTARQMLFDAQFYPSCSSPLIDYRERGNTVELLGKEDIEGETFYKLAARIKYGMETYWYISSKDYLLKRIIWLPKEGQHEFGSQGFDVHVCFDDYRDVNGRMIAHSIEDRVVGIPIKGYTIEQIEINVKVEDSFFSMP